MPHLDPLSRAQLDDVEEVLSLVEGAMGFVPNSLLTMARRPDLLRAFVAFAGQVQRGGSLDPVLVQQVAHVASTAAGCRYCQAHTGAVAARHGASAEEVGDLWDFETSPHFDEGRRAALRLARDAALQPNAVGPEHFDALKAHFDEDQIVDLVAVVSLFGFLNRWNDTFATQLEGEPAEFAEGALSGRGWTVGKHAG